MAPLSFRKQPHTLETRHIVIESLCTVDTYCAVAILFVHTAVATLNSRAMYIYLERGPVITHAHGQACGSLVCTFLPSFSPLFSSWLGQFICKMGHGADSYTDYVAVYSQTLFECMIDHDDCRLGSTRRARNEIDSYYIMYNPTRMNTVYHIVLGVSFFDDGSGLEGHAMLNTNARKSPRAARERLGAMLKGTAEGSGGKADDQTSPTQDTVVLPSLNCNQQH